jgi:hypothetical protein
MEDIGVDRRIILRCNFAECRCGGIDLIDLAQDRDSSRAFFNTLMSIGVL